MTTMEYKGFLGSVEMCEDDGLLFGKVLGVRALLSYEGTTVAELVDDFHAAVDGYLEYCKTQGIKPQSENDDTCDISLPFALYTKVAAIAESQKIPMAQFLEKAIESAV